MSKYIDAEKLKDRVTRLLSNARQNDWPIAEDYLKRVIGIIDSLQQEQPEVDMDKTVEFECIGKKVKMTIQELINYYIDSECCDVADECGF